MSEKSLLDDICIEYYAKLAYYGIKKFPHRFTTTGVTNTKTKLDLTI